VQLPSAADGGKESPAVAVLVGGLAE
jgi:hypothetical protein